VVLTPSGPVSSGLFLCIKIVPVVLTKVLPTEEKDSMLSVLLYLAAPIAIAPEAFAWPTIVDESVPGSVLCSLNVILPRNTINLIRKGLLPIVLLTIRILVVIVSLTVR